ncbi:MAG: hypothetical protein KUG81_09020 [Gammaproteobacteria bacterium]|nr:hypothetical protein [Gammaproteobacteria bacterium]
MELKLNKYQTPFSDEIKAKLPKEVADNVLEYIAQVPLIERLISADRRLIKDCPVLTYKNEDGEEVDYEDGRKRIDVTDPHILEDMDFFRQAALTYEKTGKYTNITPNANPKSEYAQFWKDELRKWKVGMVRPDGEWIPGELYFYWNFSPIWLNVDDEDMKGKKAGRRERKFPKPWLGDYLFFHYVTAAKNAGQHGKLLKTRGCGFSFKAGSWSPRNMYVLPGSGNPNFHLASEKTFLSGDKGIWGKVLDTLDWIAETTPLPRMRLVDGKRAMEVQLGYEDEYGVRKGLLSSVTGISLKDNPDKARGIRGPFIHYEEDGLFPNLEKAWNVNRQAVEDGGTAFGFMLAGGTGGTEGASFEGSEKLFYKPSAYNIYGVPNAYDRNATGDSLCGFFWGAYMNRNNCYDSETGEPDVIKALIEICEDRHIIKYGSSDALALTQKKAEQPITPQEAVMRTEGTVFPVAELKEYLEHINVKRDSFLAEHYVGELVYNHAGVVEWRPTDKFPLRTYDTTGDRTGSLEIFEMPKANGEGYIQRGRYIAGIDPIDADTGPSLFSMLVMDTFTDRIVAEYTGRPRTANEAYEIALKTIKFYNADANYEMNLKGLFSYFDKHNALHYLADTPQILKDMDMVKATNLYGNKAKGTRASASINSWGRLLQADWQRTKAYGDDEDQRQNLHKLRSTAYIEECIKWNADGNFDRVSAGIMLFILREDRVKRTESAKKNEGVVRKSLSTDPYWNKNFGSGAETGSEIAI